VLTPPTEDMQIPSMDGVGRGGGGDDITIIA